MPIPFEQYEQRILYYLGKSEVTPSVDTALLEKSINEARNEVSSRIQHWSPEYLSGIVRLDSYNIPPIAAAPDGLVSMFDGVNVVPIVWRRYELPSDVVDIRAVYVFNGSYWVEARRTMGHYEVLGNLGSFIRPALYQPVYVFRTANDGRYIIDLAGLDGSQPGRVEVWYLRRPRYLHHGVGDIDTDIPSYCFDGVVYRSMVYLFQRWKSPMDDKVALFLKMYNYWMDTTIRRLLLWNRRHDGGIGATLEQEYNVFMDRAVRRLPENATPVRRESRRSS